METKTKLIIVAFLLVAAGSYSAGRFTSPSKIVTKEVIKTVEKIVEIEKKQKHEDKNVVTVTIKKPDGTVITREEDKSVIDTKTDLQITDDKSTVSTKTQSTEYQNVSWTALTTFKVNSITGPNYVDFSGFELVKPELIPIPFTKIRAAGMVGVDDVLNNNRSVKVGIGISF